MPRPEDAMVDPKKAGLMRVDRIIELTPPSTTNTFDPKDYEKSKQRIENDSGEQAAGS
jgi:hypothetical protein